MKEKTLYTCEICHTSYANKQEAIECEKYHYVNLTIIEKCYRPKGIGSINDGFPISITLEDEKGNKAI